MKKQFIIYLLVIVLCLEGILMKCEPMKVEAATTYKYTMSYITGGGDLTSKFKITIGGKKLTGLCRHGGAKSAHSGKATAKLLSRTDKRFYLAYYYGYVKKWTSGSKGCDLARAFNYATYGNAYHQSASRSKEMINTAKEYCKKNGVPDNFVAYNCDPTNGSQEFIAWYYGANGSVKLVKKSSDANTTKTGSYTFKNIKYRVYESKSTSGTVVGTLTLNASGTSNTLKLAPNGMKAKKYYIREYSTNDYYELNSAWYTTEIKPGEDVTITAKDTPKYGTLSFTKTLTSNSAADSTVQGFEFTLTNINNSSLKYTAISDVNGRVSFTGIPIGTYTLVENISVSQAAQNYVNITGNKTVTIKAGSNTLGTSENTYVNERIVTKPRLLIQKRTDDGGSVKDWKFTVTNMETGQTFNLTTDNTGQAELKDIDAEVTHAVQENMTAQQQIRYMKPSSQSKKLKDGSEENLVFYFENKAIYQPVSLKKTAEDGKIHGIEFTLSGTPYAGTSDAFEMVPVISTTDENGYLDFGKLVPGDYVIEETGFDPNYYMNNHKLNGYDNPAIAFSVTKEGVFVEGAIVPDGQFEFINSVYGIELVKTEVLVNGTKTDNPVKDAGYELYFIESNGSETLIDSFVTDESGKFTVNGVKKGSYRLYEITAPMGYVEKIEVKNEGTEEETQSPIPIDFTVGSSESEKITVVKDTNQQKYGTIFVVKEDKDRYPVEDAQFTLFTDEACKNVAKDKDGNELVAKTDEKGYIIFDNLSWTTYYLKETQAPRGYIQSNEVHKFVIGYDVEEDIIVVDQEIWLTNEHKLGSVELLKVDEDDKPISGAATYDLYKTDGTLVAESLVTGKDNNGDGESDGIGLLRVDNLEWGSYYFLEKTAPDGYGLSSEKIRFTVNALSSSTLQKIKAVDKEEITYIIATKKIKTDDINFDNGTPSFFFHLEGTTTAGNKKVYNRSVTFSEEFVKKHTDTNGYVSLSVTFDNLPTGKYVLSEEEVARFTFDKIETSSLVHGTISKTGDTVTFDLSNANIYGAATFVNKHFESADYSDSVMLSNVVSKQRTYTALTAEYNGEILQGNQPIDNFNDYLTVYAIYDDGTERILNPEEYKVYDIDGNEFVRAPKVAGHYTLTVHHEEDEIEHSDTVEIQVEAAKKVTVKFQSNGGNALADMSVYKYDTLASSAVDTSKYIPTRTGYNFGGWYSDSALTQKVDENVTPILADTTLYAKWDIITYAITYDLKGGTLSSPTAAYTILSNSFKLGTPTREGYTFLGWTGSNGSTAQTSVIVTQGSTGNRRYTANWKANAFAIYSATDNSLRLYDRNIEIPTVGSTYNGRAVTAVYYNIETVNRASNGNAAWNAYASNITKVIVEDVIQPVSTAYWFSYLKNVSTIDVEKLDTVNTTNMQFMFHQAGYNVSSFKVTGLNDLNTAKVTTMYGLFNEAGYNAATFDIGSLANWNVAKVTNMQNMFYATGYSASAFNIGSLANWNVGSVRNMRSMFNQAGYSASAFSLGNLNNWNVSATTTVEYMFMKAGYNAKTWNIGNLSNWKLTNVTSLRSMFHTAGYSAATFNIGDISGWNVSGITNFYCMFNSTGYSAATFYVGDLSKWVTSSATDMGYMFNYAGYKASYSLNLKNWNVSKVTSYSRFNTGVTSKITVPTWVN